MEKGEKSGSLLCEDSVGACPGVTQGHKKGMEGKSIDGGTGQVLVSARDLSRRGADFSPWSDDGVAKVLVSRRDLSGQGPDVTPGSDDGVAKVLVSPLDLSGRVPDVTPRLTRGTKKKKQLHANFSEASSYVKSVMVNPSAL